MPLKWFTCPDGERIEYQKCLAEGGCRMNRRCAVLPYLRMVAEERPWTGKPSTTQLIRGTMGAFLQLTTDYAISPDDRAFMVHGTRAHGVLEKYGADSLLEQKLDGPDTPETGIFDLLEVENGKSTLVDYKTSGSYKVAAAIGMVVLDEETGEVYKSGPRKGEPKTRKMLTQSDAAIDRRDWELQLNKYRIELEKRGHKIDSMAVQCIVRDGNTWIARSRGVIRNLYYFNVAKMPDVDVLAYFKRKREALAKALKQGFWRDPCNDHENWSGLRCTRYCEVAEHCSLGKYLQKEKEFDMPILGLTDQQRLPRLGKIRLGVKEKTASGKEYPKEVDYFILDPSVPEGSIREDIMGTFRELYGDKPKTIKFMFPLDDEELVFPQWYKRYGSSTLQCKGDGATATCATPEFAKGLEVIGEDEKSGCPIVACAGDDCDYYKKKKCAKCATLNIILHELPGNGIYQLNTTSVNSILNVNGAIAYLRATSGRFHMIPLALERHKQFTTHDGKKSTHWVLFVNTKRTLLGVQRMSRIPQSDVLLELSEAPLDAVDMADYAPEQTKEIPEVGIDAPYDEIPETGEERIAEPTDYLGVVTTLAAKGKVPLEEFGAWTKMRYKGKSAAFNALLPALDSEEVFQGIMGEFSTWMDKQNAPEQGTLV